MKLRWQEGKRQNAVAVLNALKISVGQDFHTLSTTQIEGLLGEATRVRYQKPKNANGSRARYFHDLLQRQAQQKNG